MKNFWHNLPSPFFVLAPMEAVTDCAFREIFAKYGKPDVMFTEFVNVDGLLHPEGLERLSVDLKYSEAQRPIVAQIWGRNPEKFFEAAKIIARLGFDGVDINFGCPQDKEIKQKTCAALIREPGLAGEIIQAVLKGANGLPVSVKTRLGFLEIDEMESWVTHLLGFSLSALTLHARTKQEKSKVPAHWEKIKEAVKIRDKILENRDKDKKILIIGNGDIKSREEGLQRIKETGCDGIMVGRGAFGNPWIFRQSLYEPLIQERLEVMLEHAELYADMYNNVKLFAQMKKNFKAYANGFAGAGVLRAELMEAKNLEETKRIVQKFNANLAVYSKKPETTFVQQ